jgi:hypothetical protein
MPAKPFSLRIFVADGLRLVERSNWVGKVLSSFIENQPERLTREEVQAMASALTSHMRTQIKLWFCYCFNSDWRQSRKG